jgi:hypothetical protein
MRLMMTAGCIYIGWHDMMMIDAERHRLMTWLMIDDDYEGSTDDKWLMMIDDTWLMRSDRWNGRVGNIPYLTDLTDLTNNEWFLCRQRINKSHQQPIHHLSQLSHNLIIANYHYQLSISNSSRTITTNAMVWWVVRHGFWWWFTTAWMMVWWWLDDGE